MKKYSMGFFNNEKMIIEAHSDYNEFSYILLPPSQDTKMLAYYDFLDKDFNEFVNNIVSDKPVLVKVIADYKQLRKELGFSEYYSLIQFIESLFASSFSSGIPAGRERRLGVPKGFEFVKVSNPVLMLLLNTKTRFPIFNIVLVNDKNKVIESVF